MKRRFEELDMWFLDNRKMESDLSKKKQTLILGSVYGTLETEDKLRQKDYAF